MAYRIRRLTFVFLPVPIALNISSSLMPLTLGNGTEYLAAFAHDQPAEYSLYNDYLLPFRSFCL